MDGRQEREQTFKLTEENGYPVEGALTRKREYCSPVNVQSIKMKCVYNYCVQRCDIYAPIPSICNRSIPIDINLQESSSSIGHRLSISID